MEYLTDGVHLICVPYSIPNLHAMADALGIRRCWFHPTKGLAHYDLPKRQAVGILSHCRRVSSKDIVRTIRQATP